jgi:hypothetical protein
VNSSDPILDNPENDFIRKIAELYKVKVRLHSLEENVRGYKMDDEIIINENNPPERRNWTFCHELAHIVLGHSSAPSDEDEREADRFAAELMLPERDFIPDSKDLNLNSLKLVYPHASYETIARRCLQFNPGVMTIFDQKQLTCRLGSDGINFPANPTAQEMKVIEECYNLKNSVSKTEGDIFIKGFYIDQGRDIIRVILLTQIHTNFA